MKSILYVFVIKSNKRNFHVENLKLSEKSNCQSR